MQRKTAIITGAGAEDGIGFACARSMHRQLAANRCRHTHQCSTLYLVNNNGLIITVVKYGQIDRFARFIH